MSEVILPKETKCTSCSLPPCLLQNLITITTSDLYLFHSRGFNDHIPRVENIISKRGSRVKAKKNNGTRTPDCVHYSQQPAGPGSRGVVEPDRVWPLSAAALPSFNFTRSWIILLRQTSDSRLCTVWVEILLQIWLNLWFL